MIVADAHRQRGVENPDQLDPKANRAVTEYLATLDDAAFGRTPGRRSPGMRLLRENAPKSGSQKTRRWSKRDSKSRSGRVRDGHGEGARSQSPSRERTTA